MRVCLRRAIAQGCRAGRATSRLRTFALESILGLRGITLRYTHEIRSEAEYFADIPEMSLPKEMLSIAEHIIELKLEDFDPAYLEDRYRTVLVEKLRKKSAQVQPRAKPAAPSQKNVIDLMAMLQRSLQAESPASRPRPEKPARRAAAAASRSGDAKRSKRVRE